VSRMSVWLEMFCTAIIAFRDPILGFKFSVGDSLTYLPI
jgi:hypothetical protein